MGSLVSAAFLRLRSGQGPPPQLEEGWNKGKLSVIGVPSASLWTGSAAGGGECDPLPASGIQRADAASGMQRTHASASKKQMLALSQVGKGFFTSSVTGNLVSTIN